MTLSTPVEGEVRIRIGGPAGFGIKAAGQSLARVFARGGYDTFDLTEYPSLIKGGHNTYHVRVSREPVHSHVLPTDVLVALDAETIPRHLHELTRGAAVVYDPGSVDLATLDLGGRDDLCLTPVPLDDIVYEVGGIKIMRNVAALGAVLGYLGYPLDPLAESIRQQFAHKAAEIADQNIAAASKGYEFAAANECSFPYALAPFEGRAPQILVDGNESVGIGAMAAGVGLYCAYPMTPASSLLHFFAKHGDRNGVVVKHTEDEIAAMNMMLGGAFGGTRSMCATSGGGFSLMVEAFGFAGVSESACVVGLFTRPGPATGLPTWTEQSDLRFALHAAQGEFPRVVLAPGDRTQAFEYAWRAFNIADMLQTPVIVLGDSYLSDNRATTPRFDTDAVTIERGELLSEGDVSAHPDSLVAGRYARYKVTDSGVSLRALPGVEGAIQVVNSYEHDEFGYGAQAEEAPVRVAQMDKRMRKMELAEGLVPPPIVTGPEDAPLSVLCFGTTIMPLRQAVSWLADEGVSVRVMQLTTLLPFPTERVSEFVSSAATSVVIEGDYLGQLEGLIREHTLLGVDQRLRRYDGRPFAPEQLYAFLLGLMDREADRAPSGLALSEVTS